MKHIYLNLKRFDVPVQYGGVNRLSDVKDWGGYIVANTQSALKDYRPDEAEFVQYFPEAHILSALKARDEKNPLQIGCQGVYRLDTSAGGNFWRLHHQPHRQCRQSDGLYLHNYWPL